MGKEQYDRGFRKNGKGEYTSFLHDLGGKKKRVGHSDGFPKGIYSYEEAEIAKEKLLDRIDRSRKRREHKAIWIKHFQYDHKRLIKFVDWSEKRKISNAKTNYGLVKNHVLPFFLQEMSIIDPHEWYYYYDEFKEWLDERKPLRNNSKKETLADNTKNNIIKAMHSFFKYMEKVEKLGPFRRCEEYPPGGFRGLEDLVFEEERDYVLAALKKTDLKMAAYINLLADTGVRPNEGLGLHINSLVIGFWPKGEEWVLRRIIEAGHKVYGYIILRDQPDGYRLYDSSGKVPRKPLKGRKRIAPEYHRYIPIVDYELANDLAEIKSELVKGQKNSRTKLKKEDVLLFGFTYSQIATKIRKLFDEIDCRNKSLYCFRHTFITRFSGTLGGDTRLTEIIVGHADKKMMIRYNKLRHEMDGQAVIDAQEENLENFEIKAIEIC